VISVCRYFFEPFASWSWRKELAAAAAAAAVALRVRRGADLWHGIPAEAPMSGKGFLTCQGNLIGSDGPVNGTLHDGERQESGHLLTGIRGVGLASQSRGARAHRSRDAESWLGNMCGSP
jgi:hypothetical protein